MKAAAAPESGSSVSGLVLSILSEEKLIEQLIKAVQSGDDALVIEVSREIWGLRRDQANRAAEL